MAWFRKEKKPRQPRRERHEIPPDVWEKCEACGHTDIREKFVRNFNVCPSCDYHRRYRANEYCNLLLDDGTTEELELDIRSTDPLGFPEYPARLKKATTNAGDGDALLAAAGTVAALPVSLGVTVALTLFFILFLRVIRVAERASDSFASLMAFGILSGWFVHVLVNVGMTLSLMPITGIPLPFFSYGGSFLLSSWLAVGILMRVANEGRGRTTGLAI